MTLTRRHLMLGAAAALALPARSRAAPQLTDEGLYREPWFLDSFMVLPEDLAEADKAGQALRRHVGAQGLPVLQGNAFRQFRAARHRRLHQGEFRRPATQHHRLKKVTDFDGEELSEKAMAEEIQRAVHAHLPVLRRRSGQAQALLAPQEREVARAPGYFRPDDFLAMFRFVREKAYETKSLRDYLKSATPCRE